jgi:hypothetical protein
MGFNRTLKRSTIRQAYDLVGKKWREQLRSQEIMDSMGIRSDHLDQQRVGRKPPYHVFSLMVEGLDPMSVAKQSSPREILEYAAEHIMPDPPKGCGISWRGAQPRQSKQTVYDGPPTVETYTPSPIPFEPEESRSAADPTEQNRGVTVLNIAGDED